MGRINRQHQQALNVAAKLTAQKKRFQKVNAVPFGQEQLAPAEARKRMQQMTPEGRKLFWDENGSRKVMEILGNA